MIKNQKQFHKQLSQTRQQAAELLENIDRILSGKPAPNLEQLAKMISGLLISIVTLRVRHETCVPQRIADCSRVTLRVRYETGNEDD